MTLKTKLSRIATTALYITAIAIGLLPGVSVANPIMTTDLLKNLRKGEPWDRGVFAATKMVRFQQALSGGTDATSVAKITLRYFTTANCTAASGFNVPTYNTPDTTPLTSFTISVGQLFGLVAASVWSVGSTQLSITDMTTIQSVAVTFKSTNSNTPQANFSGLSFACIPVTCNSGECLSGSGIQRFRLKTTAAIGDPADGGVIACMNGGLNNLVVPTADNSAGIQWSPTGKSLPTARSGTDGATNTTTIVNCYSNNTCRDVTQISTDTYAAGICSIYTAAGGYTSGWFLPAGNNTTSSGQLNCLYTNRATIGGFSGVSYWSSTDSGSNNALTQKFNTGQESFANKSSSVTVRCARGFTP